MLGRNGASGGRGAPASVEGGIGSPDELVGGAHGVGKAAALDIEAAERRHAPARSTRGVADSIKRIGAAERVRVATAMPEENVARRLVAVVGRSTSSGAARSWRRRLLLEVLETRNEHVKAGVVAACTSGALCTFYWRGSGGRGENRGARSRRQWRPRF